jgi:hypothetical protein
MIITVIAAAAIAAAVGATTPTRPTEQLLPGYEVIATAHLTAGQPARSFKILALARMKEETLFQRPKRAPARPLLVFENEGHRLVLVGRNDHVLLRADEGGQCDPFLDGDTRIATKGHYFTVENGVACGQHWTNYITFRLDDCTGGFVFDKQRQEEWGLNPRNSPDEEALVRAAPPRVMRAPSGHVTTFAAWRPAN